MRKKLLAFTTMLSLWGMTVSPVFADLESDMTIMADNLKVVQKSNNASELKSALMTMRAAARSAQTQLPPALENIPAGSDEIKDYLHGYDLLINQIEEALKLIKEGKIKEAKSEAAKLRATRNTWHQKYR